MKDRSHAEVIAEAQQGLAAAKRLGDELPAIVRRLERGTLTAMDSAIIATLSQPGAGRTQLTITAAEYKDRAQECREEVKRMLRREDRDALERVAQLWEKLASDLSS